MKTSRNAVCVMSALFLALSVSLVCADTAANDPVRFGFKIRVGGLVDGIFRFVNNN